MIIIDIFKAITGTISRKQKEKQEWKNKLKHTVEVVENWEDRTRDVVHVYEGIKEINSRIDIMQEKINGRIDVVQESIGMIKSFFGIYDKRKQQENIEFADRRQNL